MTNQTWAVRYTDKAGDAHDIEMESHDQPTMEEAAGRIVRKHQEAQQQAEIIDIVRTDPTPKQTQLAYFGYEIIDIKLVEDRDA